MLRRSHNLCCQRDRFSTSLFYTFSLPLLGQFITLNRHLLHLIIKVWIFHCSNVSGRPDQHCLCVQRENRWLNSTNSINSSQAMVLVSVLFLFFGEKCFWYLNFLANFTKNKIFPNFFSLKHKIVWRTKCGNNWTTCKHSMIFDISVTINFLLFHIRAGILSWVPSPSSVFAYSLSYTLAYLRFNLTILSGYSLSENSFHAGPSLLSRSSAI